MGVEHLDFRSPATTALTGTRIDYRLERQVRLSNGLVEIGRFSWPNPVEYDVTAESEAYVFNLALSPRPVQARIARLGAVARREPESIGRVLLISPGCTFHLSVPKGHVRSLYCGIDRHRLDQIVGRPVDLDADGWQGLFTVRSHAIELLLNRIYDELCEDQFAVQFALEAYLDALCVELARCFRGPGESGADYRKGGLAPWRMRLLLDRIHAGGPAPQIPELAGLCGLTVRQLGRAFKIETGKTLGKYIDEAIVKRATRRLIESDCAIADIAAELGFGSTASFSFAFRRSTGVPPSELRRRAKV